MDPAARPTPRFILLTALGVVAVHFALWAMLRVPWTTLLSHWDSAWYDGIVMDGYTGNEWAFYPLYPLLVWLIAKPFGITSLSMVVGTLLSTLLFTAYVLWQSRMATSPEAARPELAPSTRTAWLVFLLSPATFAFHSHHTEGLFLLLTCAGLFALARDRWLLAAVLAGLAALCRTQGVLFSVAIAVGAALAATTPRERSKRFVLCGLISGALFGLYPLFQAITYGDPMIFAKAQEIWRPEVSIRSYFRTLWFGNAWQNTNFGSIQRHALFLLLAAGSVLAWRKSRAAGLYAALSVAIMPMPGEFVGVFRYGASLFPALFLLGDKLARAPRPVAWLVVLALAWLNHFVTRRYGLARWAY